MPGAQTASNFMYPSSGISCCIIILISVLLPVSVIADERYALAAGNSKLKPGKKLLIAERLGNVMAHEHLVAVEIR